MKKINFSLTAVAILFFLAPITLFGQFSREVQKGTITVSKAKSNSVFIETNSMVTLGDTMYCGTDWGMYYSLDKGVTFKRELKYYGLDKKKCGWCLAAAYTSVNNINNTIYVTHFFSKSNGDMEAYTSELTKSGKGYYNDSLIETKKDLPFYALNNIIRYNGTIIFANNYINSKIKPSAVSLESLVQFKTGTVVSINGGKTFAKINTDFIGNGSILDINITGSTLLIGSEAGVYSSTDNGISWTLMKKGLSDTEINAIAVMGTALFVATPSGVYKSTDNGENWVLSNKGLKKDTKSLFVNGNTIYASTCSGGLFQSNTNGEGWASIGKGLPDSDSKGCHYINSLKFTDKSIIAIMSDGYIYTSLNSGGLWERIFKIKQNL